MLILSIVVWSLCAVSILMVIHETRRACKRSFDHEAYDEAINAVQIQDWVFLRDHGYELGDNMIQARQRLGYRTDGVTEWKVDQEPKPPKDPGSASSICVRKSNTGVSFCLCEKCYPSTVSYSLEETARRDRYQPECITNVKYRSGEIVRIDELGNVIVAQ